MAAAQRGEAGGARRRLLCWLGATRLCPGLGFWRCLQRLQPGSGRAIRPPAKDVGVWLSLVEHLVRDEGVAGSNPATPTNFRVLRRATPKDIPKTSPARL